MTELIPFDQLRLAPPSVCDDAPMRPRGTVGLALAAYKLWRRLPPAQRRAVFDQARKHGPKAAAAAAGFVRSRKRGR